MSNNMEHHKQEKKTQHPIRSILKTGNKLKSCSHSQTHFPSWLNIVCFYGEHSSSWCLGDGMGWLIWKKVKLMRALRAFPYEHNNSWMVNADFSLQRISHKKEGCYQIASWEEPLFLGSLCVWDWFGEYMWQTNHQEPACKILWLRLFSFSPRWAFCIVKKGITQYTQIHIYRINGKRRN